LKKCIYYFFYKLKRGQISKEFLLKVKRQFMDMHFGEKKSSRIKINAWSGKSLNRGRG
jgi:hypothetical protein